MKENDNQELVLTCGKIYKVNKTENSNNVHGYRMLDDYGEEQYFYSHRFVIITRKMKLKRI